MAVALQGSECMQFLIFTSINVIKLIDHICKANKITIDKEQVKVSFNNDCTCIVNNCYLKG